MSHTTQAILRNDRRENLTTDARQRHDQMNRWLITLLSASFLVSGTGCQNPPPRQSVSLHSEPATQPAGPVARRISPRALLLNFQAEYWLKEGPARRGPHFAKLVSAIMGINLVKNVPGRNMPHIDETELLELLGPPDFASSDEHGASYAYLYGGGGTKDHAFSIDVDASGMVKRIGENFADRMNFSAWPQWSSYKPVSPSRRGGYLGVQLRKPVGSNGPLPGIEIEKIISDSPASQSILQPGDIIRALDGVSVDHDEPAEFARRILALKPGNIVTLTVEAPGSAALLSVVLIVSERGSATTKPLTTQPNGSAEMPSASHHFLIIPGKIAGGKVEIIYIIDEDRHLLSALTYDEHAEGMIHMRSSIALDRVFSPPGRQNRDGEAHIAGAVSGNEYTAITDQTAGGGDVLYLVDRDGSIAVFAYDPVARTVLLRAFGSVMDAFK